METDERPTDMSSEIKPLFTNARMTFVILTMTLRVLLDGVFYIYISPVYAYIGLGFAPQPVAIIVLSYMLLCATALIVPLDSTKPSNFIIGFLYILSYVPSTSLMAFADYSYVPVLWLTLSFMVLFTLCSIPLRIFPPVVLKHGNVYLYAFVALVYLLSAGILVAQFGLKLPSLDFEVYQARADFTETIYEQNRSLGYITIWMGNVIVPIIFAWSLIRRNLLLLALALMSQVYLFSLGGHKSLLFSLPLVLWIFFGCRYAPHRLSHYLLVTVIGIILLSIAIDEVSGNVIPYANAFLTMRIFYQPAELFFYYYDFFSRHQHTLFSHSIALNWLIDYPYDLPVPNLIGSEYFSDPKSSANANLWADAYAGLGAAGIMMFTVFLWLVMKLVDNISAGKSKYLVYAVLVMPLYALTNTGLLTTLSTHGLFLTIVLLLLMTRQEQPSSPGGPMERGLP